MVVDRLAQDSPLLSLADSQLRARSLRCWSSTERTEIEALLLRLLATWQADWGLPSNISSSVMRQPFNNTEARDILLSQLFGCKPGELSRLTVTNTNPSLAQVLADEAWSDFLSRIKNAVQSAEGAPSPVLRTGDEVRTTAFWDGYLNISMPWWTGSLLLQLDANAVFNLLGSRPMAQKPIETPSTKAALVPVTTALAKHRLAITAEFSPISLTLGQIQGLCLGNVIPLSQGLDEPTTLWIKTDTAHELCCAWLGRSQNSIAVELSPLVSSYPNKNTA